MTVFLLFLLKLYYDIKFSQSPGNITTNFAPFEIDQYSSHVITIRVNQLAVLHEAADNFVWVLINVQLE